MDRHNQHSLELPDKGITTFWGVHDAIDTPLTHMNLAGNHLSSFEYFGTHERLEIIDIRNNSLSSFAGLTKQRALREINVEGNPIANHPHHRVMLLLTVGFSIRRIDGADVSAAEKEAARRLGPNAALATSYGWLLDVTPRSADEYEKIISELKIARRQKARNTSMFVTIQSTLEKSSAAVESTTSTDARQVRTIAHLTQRIVQLESELASLRQQPESANVTQPSRYEPRISVSELNAVSSFVIEQVCIRTSASTKRTQCNLFVGQEVLIARHPFTDAPIFDVALRDIVSVSLDRRCVAVHSRNAGRITVFEAASADSALLLSKLLAIRNVNVQNIVAIDWTSPSTLIDLPSNNSETAETRPVDPLADGRADPNGEVSLASPTLQEQQSTTQNTRTVLEKPAEVAPPAPPPREPTPPPREPTPVDVEPPVAQHEPDVQPKREQQHQQEQQQQQWEPVGDITSHVEPTETPPVAEPVEEKKPESPVSQSPQPAPPAAAEPPAAAVQDVAPPPVVEATSPSPPKAAPLERSVETDTSSSATPLPPQRQNRRKLLADIMVDSDSDSD